MSRNEKLKKAYRDLQIQNTPDLWERISGNLSAKEAIPERRAVHIHTEAKRRHRRFLEAGIAAAACCVIFAAGIMVWNPGRYRTETGTGMGNAAVQLETTGIIAGAEMVEGTDGRGPAADFMAGEKAEVEAKDMEKAPAQEAERTAGGAGIVYYDDLPVSGITVPVPAQNTVFVSEEQYFTEEALGDTCLLSQAEVKKVFYDTEEDGQVHSAVYEIEIDKVLYAEDYVSPGRTLQVKSPLIRGGTENSVLYGLKEGGTYILPLKYEDGSYWLVFPNAPQIEVTEESGYVFHNGWQSLVDDGTSVVLMNSGAPWDFYYDRMVLREDPVFLSELTQLVEKERKSGRKT